MQLGYAHRRIPPFLPTESDGKRTQTARRYRPLRVVPLATRTVGSPLVTRIVGSPLPSPPDRGRWDTHAHRAPLPSTPGRATLQRASRE
jgi:hypothetical protein